MSKSYWSPKSEKESETSMVTLSCPQTLHVTSDQLLISSISLQQHLQLLQQLLSSRWDRQTHELGMEGPALRWRRKWGRTWDTEVRVWLVSQLRTNLAPCTASPPQPSLYRASSGAQATPDRAMELQWGLQRWEAGAVGVWVSCGGCHCHRWIRGHAEHSSEQLIHREQTISQPSQKAQMGRLTLPTYGCQPGVDRLCWCSWAPKALTALTRLGSPHSVLRRRWL